MVNEGHFFLSTSSKNFSPFLSFCFSVFFLLHGVDAHGRGGLQPLDVSCDEWVDRPGPELLARHRSAQRAPSTMRANALACWQCGSASRAKQCAWLQPMLDKGEKGG